MLMEPIIIVLIKLMGAAITGHWDLGDTGTSRDYDALVRSLGWHLAWRCACGMLNGSSAARFSSQAYRTIKRDILTSRTCSAANMATPMH